MEKLNINFTLGENDLAKIEVKDLYIILEKPSGEVIYDISNGSGSFTFEKREMFFTIKEEVLIDKSEKKLSVEYLINDEFNKGTYSVKLYTDEYKIGSGEFLIK